MVAFEFNFKMIHDDRLNYLHGLGKASTKRASHVEPEMIDGQVKWFADLAPSNGPKLGPFDTRGEAISAEIRWLRESMVSDGSYEGGEKS